VLKTPSVEEFGAATAAGITPTYSGRCDIFREGQEFIVDAGRPQSDTEFQKKVSFTGAFCPYAWEVLFPVSWVYYEAGAGREWYGNDRGIISPCPDGLRPVSFKLEWI